MRSPERGARRAGSRAADVAGTARPRTGKGAPATRVGDPQSEPVTSRKYSEPLCDPAPACTQFGAHRAARRARTASTPCPARRCPPRHDQRGAGGSGKTRVALELARSSGAAFGNGAAFVELASVQDPTLVLASIARELGVTETSAETPADALARWLQSRDLLLVLDNIEHVIESAPDVARLVQLAPRLTIVATSRRVLHVSGEHVYPLAPLPIGDAIRLFSERATARHISATTDVDRSEVIATICRRLDCLPLAVELAAARSATLGPELLLERLSDRVAALGVGPRDAPARQQTLLDTLRWSTDLLSEAERRTLARLSVFSGGSSVEAAEAVCATDIELLAGLIDSSLVHRTAAGGSIRLSMLETIREHAAQLLGTAGDRLEAEARHATYYVAFVEALDLKSPATQADALARVDADIDNLRVVIDRAELCGDDDTALRGECAVSLLLHAGIVPRGKGQDRWAAAPRRWRRALGRLAPALSSGMHFMLGDLESAEAVAREGIEIGPAANADEAVMACHTVVSHVARERGLFSEAKTHLERSEALARALGLDEDVIIANTNLGELALAVGDLDEARRRWEFSMSEYDENDVSCTFALLGLASVAHRQGLLDEAAGHFTKVRALSESAGWLHNATMAIVGLAGVATDRGAHSEAAVLPRSRQGATRDDGGELVAADDEIYQRAWSAALTDLGEARFAELLATGAADGSHCDAPA
ncbi:MAG: AAA family ATPase [Ilumatobacteraceae bacterium]